MTTGNVPYSVPAMMIDCCGANPVDNPWKATWIVGFCELSEMIGQKKSFHVARNVSIPSTAIAGRTAGTTTWRKVRNVPAPSTYAASSSSSGTPATTYWRMKKTPKAVTIVGRITDWRWPARPSAPSSCRGG